MPHKRLDWIHRSVVVLGAALLTFGSAVPSQALEAKDWDQAEATRLSGALSERVGELYGKARIEGREGVMTVKSAANYVFIEDMKLLMRHVKALSQRLEKGEGKAETDVLFRRIQGLVPRVRISKQRSVLLENSQPEIDRAREALDALTVYYGALATPDVASPPAEKKPEAAE